MGELIMTYEELIIESKLDHIYELDMSIKGLYCDGVIGISKHIDSKEKNCILAEELGHHFTTVGDILDQRIEENRRQEEIARRWAYRKLIPLEGLIDAHKTHISNLDEITDFFSVPYDFFFNAIQYYKNIYGLFTFCDQYVIYFEPLSISQIY